MVGYSNPGGPLSLWESASIVWEVATLGTRLWSMRLALTQTSEVLRKNQRLDALSPAFVFSGSCRQSKDACLQPVPHHTKGFYITYLRVDGWPKLYDNV